MSSLLGKKKKAHDSLIGRISHDIQAVSVDQSATDMYTSSGRANFKTLCRLQMRHIELSLSCQQSTVQWLTTLFASSAYLKKKKKMLLLSCYMEKAENSFIMSVSPFSLQHKQVFHPTSCIYLCQSCAYIYRHSTHFSHSPQCFSRAAIGIGVCGRLHCFKKTN